jgi:hypothetical protein
MRKSGSIDRGAEVRTEDGAVHRITDATMLAAMDRAQKYLKEAIRWSVEFASHIQSGKEQPDTRGHNQVLKRTKIPTDVWFPVDNAFTEADRLNVMATLHHWTEGTLEDFEEAYNALEAGLDLDPTYILFGLPIRDLSIEAQAELRRIGRRFATRKLGVMAALN